MGPPSSLGLIVHGAPHPLMFSFSLLRRKPFLFSRDTKSVRMCAQSCGRSRQQHLVFLSFLSRIHGRGVAPICGVIFGILKQMGDSMAQNFVDATFSQEAAIESLEELMVARSN